MSRVGQTTRLFPWILSLLFCPMEIQGQEEAVPDSGAQLPDSAAPLPDSAAPLPVSPIRAEMDQRSQEDLLALFQRIPGLEGVEVRVDAGVAFLSGTALSTGDAALADSLARATTGILHVDNRIREETSVSSRLGPLGVRVQEKLLVGLAYLPLLLLAALVVGVFFLLGGVVARWEAPFRRMADNPFLRTLLSQIAGGAVGLVGVLLALELLDATALVGAVLGAAGVAGVAVGFAFRNIAENYLAGIILSIRQPFSPDDQILVEGQEGKVIRLTSRETILMTLDGNHVRIPNATIFNSVIINYTRNPLRRFRFDLSVGQSEDLARVQEIGVGALRGLDGILGDPAPRSTIDSVGDSWVLLRFFGWTNQNRTGFDKVRSEAIRLTKEALDRAGVAMPAPEYGLRFLGEAALAQDLALTKRSHPSLVPDTAKAPGITLLPDAGKESAAPPAAGTAAGTAAAPAAVPAPDLSPDRELEDQIARDREETAERDLLDPAGETGN